MSPVRDRAAWVRYFILGVATFVIDAGTLLAIADFLPLVAANTIAFFIANLVNFAVGHRWVFGRDFREGWLRAYSQVAVISVIGLVLNDAIVWAGVVLVAFPLLLAKAVATAITFAWNFLARARLVYPAPPSP
jgi:putative flippase GtrA